MNPAHAASTWTHLAWLSSTSWTTEMLWGSRWSLVKVLRTIRSRSRPVMPASSSAICAASMAICAQPSPGAAR